MEKWESEKLRKWESKEIINFENNKLCAISASPCLCGKKSKI